MYLTQFRWLDGLALLACLNAAAAQSPRSFEAASIRPHEQRASRRPSSRITATQFELVNVSPRDVVERAFDVRAFQVVAPDWATTERFNIRAALPSGAAERDVPGMLQALLIERFGFNMHVEVRPTRVYELVTSPSGANVREVAPLNELDKTFTSKTILSDNVDGLPGDELREIAFSTPGTYQAITPRTSYSWRLVPPGGVMHLDSERMTMADFVRLLNGTVDRPIVDRTGLTAIYQFRAILPPRRLSPTMKALLGDRVPSDPSGVDLSRSLEGLGLELRATTAALAFVVIDAIERPATD